MWRVYDDAQVETSSWDSLQQLVRRRSEDTPYVLFYERMDGEECEEEMVPCVGVRDMVSRDNNKYRAELTNKGTNTPGIPRDGPRPDDDPGGGPGGSCGDNLSPFGAGRFVC